MNATLEQQIAHLNHQVTSLQDDVERLRALIAAIHLTEPTPPPKRGPGRPRTTNTDG